jgi:hypothetical protein
MLLREKQQLKQRGQLDDLVDLLLLKCESRKEAQSSGKVGEKTRCGRSHVDPTAPTRNT